MATAATGVPAVSEGGPPGAAVAVSEAVGMTVSAGAVAVAVGVAECARGWADGRVV